MRRLPSLTKLLLATALAAGLLVGGSTGAGAQDTTLPDCGQLTGYSDTAALAANPPVVNVGDVITVSGSGFPADYPLVVFLNGTAIREVVTDVNGTFSFPYTTTAAESGRQLVFTTDFCAEAFTTTVTVNRAGGGGTTGGGGTGTTGTGSSSLPRTGSDSGDLARIGVLLLGAGAIAVGATRRRRAHHTAA